MSSITHRAATTSKPFGIIVVTTDSHRKSRGSRFFSIPIQRLQAAGFRPVLAIDRQSHGSDNEDQNKGDVKADLLPYLEQGTEFIAVSHSYGGTPLTIATDGLSVKERTARRLNGGIRAVVYLASNMAPRNGTRRLPGAPPTPPPSGANISSSTEDGLRETFARARAAFYGTDINETGPADAHMVARLLPQAKKTLLDPASFVAEVRAIAAYYIVCDEHRILMLATREQVVSTVPRLKRVLRKPDDDTGCPSQTDVFVEQIVEIARDLL